MRMIAHSGVTPMSIATVNEIATHAGAVDRRGCQRNHGRLSRIGIADAAEMVLRRSSGRGGCGSAPVVSGIYPPREQLKHGAMEPSIHAKCRAESMPKMLSRSEIMFAY
jgi:hypothetical protein